LAVHALRNVAHRHQGEKHREEADGVAHEEPAGADGVQEKPRQGRTDQGSAGIGGRVERKRVQQILARHQLGDQRLASWVIER
jgi:hypothetical protein